MSQDDQLKILIVGRGGREHALAWKITQSKKVSKLFITPGNAGTALLGENLELTTSDEILEWLKKNPVDIVIIGPDDYLADGLTDKIQSLNIFVFGPTKTAAEIEWSKSFAKKLMLEEGIPTAKSESFIEYIKAKEYIAKQQFPLVIKADGLALGKGVIIAKNEDEAVTALTQIMENKAFGNAGKVVVIEEFLDGREISIHAFCDGENIALFPSSQDHKRIYEDDEGLNTGGMGTIASVPWVTDGLMQEIKEKIVLPCVNGLKKRGRPFVGVLYPGIMVTSDGPKVIEFNARFGDPETQSYMRLLDTDLVEIILACVNQTLDKLKIQWAQKSACCVIAASGGYPGQYEKGKLIHGLGSVKENGVVVFHSGTKQTSSGATTNGGRVLGVTAIGENLADSLEIAYRTLRSISFDGMQFRKDIGLKSL